MRIYQVSYRSADDQTHEGYSYHRSKAEARRAIAEARRAGRMADFALSPQFPPNGVGLMLALEKFATHPDNG